MNKQREDYSRKRAEAIRELHQLRNKLLSSKCSVDIINRAFSLKIKYNL